jgi:glycosyltransferase involved in cell wall biosynthesis
MRVSIYLDFRFYQSADGSVWTDTAFATQFWERYLDTFDEVEIVARAADVEYPKPDWLPVAAPWLRFTKVPFYKGALDFARHYLRVRRAIWSASKSTNAVILRGPSNISNCIYSKLRATGQPYGIEVVGDPFEAFNPRAIRHPLGGFIRNWLAFQLRNQVRQAKAVGYVSSHTLPKRYPSNVNATAEYYSSIVLQEGDFIPSPRAFAPRPTWRVVSIGSLEQLYKGPAVLIEAIRICKERGYRVESRWIGDGQHLAAMERLALEKGVDDVVEFVGRVSPGQPIHDQFDTADIFVLPSLTEGLPRAMIEAMARGLPCIGSDTGGIPELLEPSSLVSPGCPSALADKIIAFISKPQDMAALSCRNRNEAKRYLEGELRTRRNRMYARIREEQQLWASKGKAND